jgi:uncharacterized protein (DUF362 family)
MYLPSIFHLFKFMNSSTLQVVLQRCDSYDRSVIAELIDLVMCHFEHLGSLHGTTVLLKPNLISSSGPGLACTHGGFVAGVALWFLGQGAKVLVGDSPAFGSAVKVCQNQRISEALQGLDVKLIDFISPVRIELSSDCAVTVAREALECDLFVGLPKIKAHKQMFVTMAVKNVFGIVKGVNKAMLHMVHGDSHARFAAIILDLVSLLPSQLHLADGIEVMHRSGPLDGSSLALNCLAAARCPVALDTAMLSVLELDPNKSPLWLAAAQRGLAGSDLDNHRYPLLSPQNFHGSGFEAPVALNGIRFNPFRFLLGLVKRVVLKVSG